MPSFAYAARYKYTDTVTQNDNLLRISAYHDAYQTPLMSAITTEPPSTPMDFRDSYGNPTHHVRLTSPHRELTILSIGKALLKSPPSPSDVSLKSIEYDATARGFLAPSPLVTPGRVSDAATQIAGNCQGLLETVGAVIDWVYTNITYERGLTSVATSAEHILATRKGVCQDMTHLAIALLRSLGVPTRYVSGLLTAQAGETHAWIEFLHPSLGWLPAVPTRGHRLARDADLIKFAMGMDYTHASPVEGTFVSRGTGRLDAAIGKVTPDDATLSFQDALALIQTPPSG